MKTITRKLVSTMPANYGEVLQEISHEVPDDYEERKDEPEKLKEQTTVYYTRVESNDSSLLFVTILAVISVIVSLTSLALNL